MRLPRTIPCLTYSYQVMLRDLRQALARELRKQRKIKRLKGKANE